MIRLSKANSQSKLILQSVYAATRMRFSTLSREKSEVEGFTQLSSDYSSDFHLRVNELMHDKSGAKIYHLENEDPDNTFATIFKTFPEDSKGCPHILEHLSCCGSQKYPIRDPFFNMLKRSVNSYMNAWTGEDFTCYPFSSANPKDYQNLLSVYSDMSFNPTLNELDFLQEGWRHEIDENGNKEIKGIVFNQMKGYYQSAERQLMVTLNEALFGGTGYRHDSGGKPEEIVNLTYAQLKKMHDYFYHPSNMSLFFYGNQNISQSLKHLQNNYLSVFSNTTEQYRHNEHITPQIPKQHYRTISSKNAECNSVSLYYYLKNLQELTPVEGLCLRILSYLMFQKNTSYAYENFIEKGITQNLGYCGFNESKLITFGATLKGVSKDYDGKKFETDMRNIFQKVLSEGLPEARMKEFLHQLEIGIKTPRDGNGIRMLQQFLIPMNHRLKLIDLLSPLKHIQEAKETLLNPQKLRGLIERYFLNNEHYVVIQQLRQDQANDLLNQKETNIVSNVQQTEEQILSNQQKLKEHQSQTQDVSILPKMRIQDLISLPLKEPKLIEKRVYQSESANSKKSYSHYHINIPQDITFYRFVFKLKNLPFDLNDKLGLWVNLMNKGISTKAFNYKQLSSQLSEYTAGLSIESNLGGFDGNESEVNLVLKVSCLNQNKEQMLKIVEEVLFESRYEKDNVRSLFTLFENEVIETLTGSPFRQSVDECGSSISVKGRISNRYAKIKSGLLIARNSELEKSIEELKQINELLLKCPEVMLIQHSNSQPKKLPDLFERFQNSQRVVFNPPEFSPSYISKAVTHNFTINFCSQQYLGPKYLSVDHAYMQILTEFLEQEYLHPQIRQKGGAYGARAAVSQNGNISLYSYMDPENARTFEVFDKSVQTVQELDSIPSDTLEEIKIKLIGEMERASVPQNQCVGSLIKGYTNEQYRQYIKYTKQASAKGILQAGRKYLLKDKRSRCVFGKECITGFQEEKLSDII